MKQKTQNRGIPFKHLFTFVLYLFITTACVRAQDPYSRLKIASQKTAISKEQLKQVEIKRSNPDWEATKKNPIAFTPFELKDKNGNAVPPDRPVTLKNGKTITAQEYIEKLNELERKLTENGFTLRNKKTIIASRTVTKDEYLNKRVAAASTSVAPLKSEAQIKQFMSPSRQVSDITLKPYDTYSRVEKSKINSTNFSKSSNGELTGKKINTAKRNRHTNLAQWGNLKSLHTTDITNHKEWSFGDPGIFAAGIEGTLHRYAKIYPFNPQQPEKSMSEFKVSAKGKIWGSLFGNSLDLLSGNAEFNAPADTSKKMKASLQVKAAGITLFNFSREYRQSASFSDFYGKEFDKSFPIEIPIGYGFDFKGKIGAKGRAGFEYGGTIYRTFVSVQGKPVAEIEGYAEAGIEFLDILGGGVGGKLTFLKGNLSLDAFAGIWAQDAEQIVLAISYHFGYDLEMLSGSLYCYLEACAPDWLGGDCWRPIEHKLFEWNGYKKSGTITEGTESFVIANIEKRETPAAVLQ